MSGSLMEKRLKHKIDRPLCVGVCLCVCVCVCVCRCVCVCVYTSVRISRGDAAYSFDCRTTKK